MSTHTDYTSLTNNMSVKSICKYMNAIAGKVLKKEEKIGDVYNFYDL